MCRFIEVKREHIPTLEDLHNKFLRYLEDDYSQDTLTDIIKRTTPFFWVITPFNNNRIAGFVYLENIIGNQNKFHSAEVTTCFHPDFWGYYTKYCAKMFFKNCFDKYQFKKIKAQVYPENYRVKTLLKSCGFEKEAELKNETLRKGKLQNIEIFSVFKEDYEV